MAVTPAMAVRVGTVELPNPVMTASGTSGHVAAVAGRLIDAGQQAADDRPVVGRFCQAADVTQPGQELLAANLRNRKIDEPRREDGHRRRIGPARKRDDEAVRAALAEVVEQRQGNSPCEFFFLEEV